MLLRCCGDSRWSARIAIADLRPKFDHSVAVLPNRGNREIAMADMGKAGRTSDTISPAARDLDGCNRKIKPGGRKRAPLQPTRGVKAWCGRRAVYCAEPRIPAKTPPTTGQARGVTAMGNRKRSIKQIRRKTAHDPQKPGKLAKKFSLPQY